MAHPLPRPPAVPRPRILFLTATRIGDAVLSTGILAHLVERYPDARFTVAAGPEAISLFAGLPRVERLIPIVKRPYNRHWLDLYLEIFPRRWFLSVDLRGSVLPWLLLTRHRRITARPDLSEHRVVELARLLALDEPPPPGLWLLPRHAEAAECLCPGERPTLAVAPAANWAGKQWPAERFAELLRRLCAPSGPFAGWRVAVIAAAHERPQADPVLRALPAEQRLDVVGQSDLLVVAAVLGRCRVFVGNDSGLMHMAAAQRVPTVGLFGRSSVARYRPWGPAAMAVQAPAATDAGHPIDSLTVDAVEAAVIDFAGRCDLLGRPAIPEIGRSEVGA